MRSFFRMLAGACSVLILSAVVPGCVSIPDGAKPVSPFDLQRYGGLWYEMARLDFRYERNLDNVTAYYTANPDGSIAVRNRGRDTTTGKWKQSVGKAKSVGEKTIGRLKVSFFGPFYSGYNVIAIDPDYRYALVAGDDLHNMWILARSPQLPAEIRRDYLAQAKDLGYDTAELVWTPHTGAQFDPANVD